MSGAGPMAHVIGVLSIIVAWNHAWSIPGSVLWVRFRFFPTCFGEKMN